MDRKYKIDTKENIEFLKSIREGLLDFGYQFPAPDGSSYYLGDDGTPWKDRPRETWITSRMVHVYSIGTLLGYPGGSELAEAGIKGLKTALRDTENGGWYAGVKPDGESVPGKQCYAHAFVILAASSAVLAGITGAHELLEDALSAYDRFFWDEEEGLARDTWNTEFTECDSYRGLNANMHSVEAFLAAADSIDGVSEIDVTDEASKPVFTGSEEYRERVGRIIDRVTYWAKENNWRIPEHFTEDWEPVLDFNRDKPDDQFKPYGATPGHGIEWARLIVQWAASTYADGGTEYEEYIDAAEHLYNRAVEDAWDSDGAPGLVYTTDWNGTPVVHDRMHWTLAEAVNTSSVLYRATGDVKYADQYAGFMKYLDDFVLDKDNGSWFHQLDRDNQPEDTVWPGKPDIYHAFQSTLIPYHDVSLSIAAAVKEACD